MSRWKRMSEERFWTALMLTEEALMLPGSGVLPLLHTCAKLPRFAARSRRKRPKRQSHKSHSP